MDIDLDDEEFYEIPDLSEIDENNVQSKLKELEDEKISLEREIATIIRQERSLNQPNLASTIAQLQAKARQCAQRTDLIVDDFEQQKRNADNLNDTLTRVKELHSNLQLASQELATLSSIEAIANRLNQARAKVDDAELYAASCLLEAAEAEIAKEEDTFKRELRNGELKIFDELRSASKRLLADLVCEISEAYRDGITVTVSATDSADANSSISSIRFAKKSHRVAIYEVFKCAVRCRENAPHLCGRLCDLFDTMLNSFLQPLVCDTETKGSSPPLSLNESADAFSIQLRRNVQASGSPEEATETIAESSKPAESDWDVDLVDPEIVSVETESTIAPDSDTFSSRLESAKRRLDAVSRFLQFLRQIIDKSDKEAQVSEVYMEFVHRVESRLTDLLIEHVLKSSLPTCAEQLAHVSGLRELVSAFSIDLMQLGFFRDCRPGTDETPASSEENNPLTRYVSNVCAVFAEKKALVALERARKLVRDANLFETQSVPANYDSQFAIALRSSIGDAGEACDGDGSSTSFTSLKDRFESLIGDYMEAAGSSRQREAEDAVAEQFGAFINAQARFDDSLFLKLPRCKVSSFARELIELVRKSIEEAFQLAACDNSNTIQFTPAERICLIDGVYEATRNVFDTFSVLVTSASVASPQFDELPQSAAIQYCNAHYLAHYAALFQLYFSLLAVNSLDAESLSGKSAFDCYSFFDVQVRLRQLGSECISHQMRLQRGVLVDQILGSLNFASLEDAATPASAKAKASCEPSFAESARVFRQCSLQLDALGRVWCDVLPVNVYRRCIAALVNECFRFLFEKVVALEDIGAYEASFLSDSLASLQKHSVQLIIGAGQQQDAASDKRSTRTNNEKLNELEASRHVSKWSSIDELRFVLNATMAEIDERWCDAQGPLAQVFDASQLRSLVRALFENNDRRAVLLSKIK